MTYINRKEKWWFHSIRAINWFAYRFWWLALLIFFLLITMFYFFCWQKNMGSCDQANKALKTTKEAIKNSANCCNSNRPENVLPCDYQAAEAGGQGYHENAHWLGDYPGRVTIEYDMYNQMDKMEVYYDDQLVASTNRVVAGVGYLEFNYPATPGKPKFCKVILTAPESGTSWRYNLNCPK